jgi:hypothetical protein
MTSTQISSENKNFWEKLNPPSTIQLTFTNTQITDPILKPSENPDAQPTLVKNVE